MLNGPKLSTLRVCLLCYVASSAAAQEVGQTDRFQLPERDDPATMLAFMQALAEPGHDFNSREAAVAYTKRAAHAIALAADRVLSGPSEDGQKVAAIELKMRSLKMLDGVGDPAAHEAALAYSARLRSDDNPALALTGLRIYLGDRLRHWQALPQAEKSATLHEVADVLQRHPASVEQIRLLTLLADVLGDTPERGQALELIDPMIDPFEKLASDQGPNSVAAQKLVSLQGVLRRLRLPGQQIEVEGELLSGQPIDWESYRGKVVLIDYWATWCGPCQAELPNIHRLHEQYADQGFEVVGVCLDDDKARVQSFLTRRGYGWPTLFGHARETRGWKHPMVSKYGVFDLPRAILVDRQGRVVQTNARGKRLAVALSALFKQPHNTAASPSPSRIEQTVHLDE